MYNNISLQLIKKQCNIDPDFTEDDQLLLQYYDAVVDAVAIHLDTEDGLDSYIDEDGNLPSALVQCILLQVATLYANRENVSVAMMYEVPFTYTYLLQKYRRYTC